MKFWPKVANAQIIIEMYSIVVKDEMSEKDIVADLMLFFKKWGASIASLDVNSDQSEDVLFERFLMKGDFCMQLFVYTKIVFEVKELALLIGRAQKTAVLIGDNHSNPFSWILITEKEEQTVYQQVDEKDEHLFLIKKQ